MKKLGKILLLTLLLVLSVLVVVSCSDDDTDGDDGDVEITVKAEAMQRQYVLGEELDLSGAVLSVNENGTTTEIPLTSESVSVTGYDKNKVGEQTLTVTYKGKTATITVNVVARMTLSDYVADYLVGDSFNTSKGKLKITRDDGTTYTVSLSDPSVTIEGFDSTAAATEKALTARYKKGDVEYTVSFAVNIFAIESVELHKPNALSYNSHYEGGLDVSGGYLLLKGNGGKLTRDVTLTTDMVSGFDLSAVNKSNTPLNQTLTVTYDNKTYTYEVKLVYTDISFFNENVSKFTSLVWTGTELPAVSEEDGMLALELMELYLSMTKANRDNISASDALSVAKAAIAYGYVDWMGELLKYEDVIAISTSTGALEIVSESYAKAKAAISALSDETSPLYATAPIINKIVDEFSSETLLTDTTFADCAVIDAATFRNKVSELKYIVELYDKLSVVPADWADKDAMTYESNVKEIYSFIMDSLYSDSSATQLYAILSVWREDSFDILYSYYFAKNDMESITALASLRLPGELQDLFGAVAGAFNQISQINGFGVFDTTGFFYYYYKTLELSENVKSSDNAIIKQLYDTLVLNGLIGMTDISTEYHFDTLIEYFRTANGGSYQYYASAMLGKVEFEQIIEAYVSAFTKLVEIEGYEKTAEYGEAMKSIFNMYVMLTPTEQLNFLGIVNAYYNYGYPPLAFDDSSDYVDMISIFNQILNQYFRSQMPNDKASAAYDNLVLAMEIYAQRTGYENWEKEFTTRMNSVISTYNGMSNADKAIFDDLLSVAYNKYVTILAIYDDSHVPAELGEWADTFGALEEAIVNIDNAYYLLEQGYPVYNLLFSAYERAAKIVETILTNAPEEIKNAYLYEELYTIPSEVTGEDDHHFSYEYMMNLYRGIYIECLCGFFGGSYNYYEIYNELKLYNFLDLTYELVWTFAWEYAFGSGTSTPPVFDKENTLMLMKAFCDLDRDSKVLFVMMEDEYGLYYEAIVKFLAEAFTEGAASVGYKMIELEQLLIVTDPTDTATKAELEANLSALEEAYAALEGEDKASFAELEEIYADIIGDCRDMIDVMTNGAAA